MVGDQDGRADIEAAEPVLVRGQRLLGRESPGAHQRGQVVTQRVRIPGAVHPDVGADPGEHVVAGEQHARGGVVQAQVTRGVPGSPDRPDRPARDGQQLAVGHEPVGLGHLQQIADPARLHDQGGNVFPRNTVAAQPLLVGAGLPVPPEAGRQRLSLRAVHRDPGPAFLPDPGAQPVMVGWMWVTTMPATSPGVTPAAASPPVRASPAVRGVPAGVDDHRARVRGERIAQRVPQRIVRDGDRYRPQARPDLLDGRQHPGPPGVPLLRPGHLEPAAHPGAVMPRPPRAGDGAHQEVDQPPGLGAGCPGQLAGPVRRARSSRAPWPRPPACPAAA